MDSIDLGRYGPTTLNGVTSVQICPAPAAGLKREVVGIVSRNADTAAVTLILELDINGTKEEIDRVPTLTAGATDKTMASVNNPIHLLASGPDSLYIRLAAAPSANQPKVTVFFRETTDNA